MLTAMVIHAITSSSQPSQNDGAMPIYEKFPTKGSSYDIKTVSYTFLTQPSALHYCNTSMKKHSFYTNNPQNCKSNA
jgi:hypothetical protein